MPDIWTIVGFLLTLLIFSYVLGDNFLFRLASAVFVGVTTGYVAALLIYQVIWPRLILPILGGDMIHIIPLALAVLLIFKIFPRITTLGNLPMAYLVGVAAAVAISGAVVGTLLGQSRAAINSVAPVSGGAVLGIITLLGTITTLAYFHFGARQRPTQQPRRLGIIEALAQVGQVFIAITLGALFAGVLAAALTALIERMDFLTNTISGLVK